MRELQETLQQEQQQVLELMKHERQQLQKLQEGEKIKALEEKLQQEQQRLQEISHLDCKQQLQQTQDLKELLQYKQLQLQEILGAKLGEDGKEMNQEARERAEVHNISSKAYKEAMKKAAGKSESEVRQMMSRGEVVMGMWTSVWARCSEAQKRIPGLEKEQADTEAQVMNVKEQMMELQEKERGLEEKLKEVEHKLSSTRTEAQTLDTIERLANAEKQGVEVVNKRLKEEKENTVMSVEDVGLFMNAAGMAHNARRLVSLAEQENMTEISLADVELFIRESVSAGNRAEIQFAIGMVKHDQYPPYDKHCGECSVCKNTVEEVTAEYQIEVKEGALAKMNIYTSSSLMYLEPSDIKQLAATNTNTERLKVAKAIRSMRQNHISYITEQPQEHEDQEGRLVVLLYDLTRVM